jgi:UDP:flavonoid glycosyltransferase YjiC (YdhE family)
VSCWPVLGQLMGMLPLARAAGRAGHDVVIATGADLAGVVEREGFVHWSVGASRGEVASRFRSGVTKVLEPGSRVNELVPLAMAWQPDLIVHGVGEPAGAVAAAYTGARHAVHGFGLFPTAGPALYELDATYLDVVPPSLRPPGPIDFHRVRPMRPTIADIPQVRRPLELDGLPHRDTVYLTLGTMGDHRFDAAVRGLASLPVNVIVTVGPGADPRRLGARPPNVRVTDYIPQELLLPHCRLVISHGGAGTVSGALSHGLAQLILPSAPDQFHTAGAVQAAGAGLSLPPEVLTADAVADDATRLLTQARFTESAQRVKADLDAMPAPDDVLAGLLHDAAVN